MDKDEIVARIEAGETFGEVAEALGISRNVVAGIWNRSGRCGRMTRKEKLDRQLRRSRAIKGALLAEILALYATGSWSISAIAKRYGYSTFGVRRALDRAGVAIIPRAIAIRVAMAKRKLEVSA
jgi:DNA-binding transcriptional regulator LsrR (DeoR family)